ncbi:MAG TPA: hypothetical protein VEJ67_01170 [Candidatus Cybelea sp.]|nr:hypothetical protein [Candidatus Cybelea sp.]
MKTAFTTFGLLAMLLATLTLGAPARAQEKAMTWTGWISDSGCAAKGANAGHKACAEKCVKEKGAKWVFVDSKTKRVLPIENQDAISDANLGQEVKLTGTRGKDGTLHVDSISNAMSM